MKQSHPCLLITPERLAKVRRLEHPLQKEMFQDMMSIRPSSSAQPLPHANPVMPGRGVRAMFEAVRYMLTGREMFARRSCREIEAYITEDAQGTANFDYEALGVIYTTVAFDCLYDYIPRPLRRKLLERLRTSVDIVYEDAERLRPTTNNHYTRRVMALAAASWALRGELAGTDRWLDRALRKLEAVLRGAPPDSGDPYGGTWLSTHPLHPLYAAYFHANNGIDVFEGSPYFRGLARFRCYAALGDGDHSLTLSANSHALRNLYDASELYIFAARYRDSHAQWMAHRIRELSRDAERVESVRPFYEFYECDPALCLLTFDPEVEAIPPADSWPSSACFRKSGWAILRDDWRRFGPVFALRCAKPGGNHWHPDCDPDFWHSQPSANEVFLYLAGQFLLNGPGPVVQKSTALCNTMTIDGKGQRPIDEPLDEKAVRLSDLISEGDYDFVMGEASGAYPENLCLHRFQRSILFIRPRTIIIRDECVLSRPAKLDFWFHSRGKWLPLDSRRFLLETDGAKAVVSLPPGVKSCIGPTFCPMGYSSYCDPIEHLCVSVSAPLGGTSLTTVWSLLGNAPASSAPTIASSHCGMTIESTAGREIVAFSGAESGKGSHDYLQTDAAVCAVGTLPSGHLRRAFVLNGTNVDVAHSPLFCAEKPVELLSLAVGDLSAHMVVISSEPQTIRIRLPELETENWHVCDGLSVIPVAAGRTELSAPLAHGTRSARCRVLSVNLSAVKGSVTVESERPNVPSEMLLVAVPSTDGQPVAEVVRLIPGRRRTLSLSSGIVHEETAYVSLYLSDNLIANGDMGEMDARYWSVWGGPFRQIKVVEESHRALLLETNRSEAVAYQTIMGLECGVEYALSCRYHLVRGSAALEYHDPRKPDLIPLCHSEDWTELTVNVCFMFPERPGPWRGGHRNRPEFFTAFRLAPFSELLISQVWLRRR